MKLPMDTDVAFSRAREIVLGYRASTAQLYDGSNPGPHDDVSEVDVMSLGVLNAFGGGEPSARMGELWDNRDIIPPLVAPITRLPLVELDASMRRATAVELDRLLTAVQGIHGLGGGVGASKLIHRLRPNVAPVWDRYAGTEWYGASISWTRFIEATYELVLLPENLQELTALMREARSEFNVSVPLLRIWDILMWAEGQR